MQVNVDNFHGSQGIKKARKMYPGYDFQWYA